MYPRVWPAWEAPPLGFPGWVLWILLATIYWTIAIFQMLWQGFLVMIILILRATLRVENWHPHSWMKLSVMCPWPWAEACKSQDLNPLGSDLTQSFESLTIFTKPLWGSYNFLQVSRLQSRDDSTCLSDTGSKCLSKSRNIWLQNFSASQIEEEQRPGVRNLAESHCMSGPTLSQDTIWLFPTHPHLPT